jgi:hypothetical protein
MLISLICKYRVEFLQQHDLIIIFNFDNLFSDKIPDDKILQHGFLSVSIDDDDDLNDDEHDNDDDLDDDGDDDDDDDNDDKIKNWCVLSWNKLSLYTDSKTVGPPKNCFADHKIFDLDASTNKFFMKNLVDSYVLEAPNKSEFNAWKDAFITAGVLATKIKLDSEMV